MLESSDPKIHRVRPRRWSTLGAAAATGLLATSPMVVAWAAQGDAAAGKPIALAQSCEGGEAGHEASAGDDAEYLAELGYVSGHLRVGMALYEAGGGDLAKTHMKHPGDEIYTHLAPELEEHGAPGFEAELAALAAAVENGAPVDQAKAAFDKLIAAIKTARDAAGEYADGVVDGKILMIHEYQDAWGFIQAAKHDLDEVAAGDDAKAAEAATKMRAHLDGTDAAFFGLTPDGAIDSDASVIFGAAARMELVAYRVR